MKFEVRRMDVVFYDEEPVENDSIALGELECDCTPEAVLEAARSFSFGALGDLQDAVCEDYYGDGTRFEIGRYIRDPEQEDEVLLPVYAFLAAEC